MIAHEAIHLCPVIRESDIVELNLIEAERCRLLRNRDIISADIRMIRIYPGLALAVPPHLAVLPMEGVFASGLCKIRVLERDDAADRIDALRLQPLQQTGHIADRRTAIGTELRHLRQARTIGELPVII